MIVNDDAKSCLPFSAQALIRWRRKTDIERFLCAIHDSEGTVVLKDGTRKATNYKDYGKYLFIESRKDFRAWAHRFLEKALSKPPSGGASRNSVAVPDFYEDPQFGKTAKYLIAWKGLVSACLSSGAFFSIAHILESEDDLNCSISLAAQLNYKHSSQVLRGFLEDIVLPLHFSEHPAEYEDWKSNNYRTPPLRGKNGILKALVVRGVLSTDLSDRVSALYGNLNGFVHGSERRLINKGQYTRAWMGQVFLEKDYEEWCQSVQEAVALGIQLLQINLNQWQLRTSGNQLLCPICHNDDVTQFKAEQFTFGKELFTRYQCLKCGDEIIHSQNHRQAYTQTFGDEVVSMQY